MSCGGDGDGGNRPADPPVHRPRRHPRPGVFAARPVAACAPVRAVGPRIDRAIPRADPADLADHVARRICRQTGSAPAEARVVLPADGDGGTNDADGAGTRSDGGCCRSARGIAAGEAPTLAARQIAVLDHDTGARHAVDTRRRAATRPRRRPGAGTVHATCRLMPILCGRSR